MEHVMNLNGAYRFISINEGGVVELEDDRVSPFFDGHGFREF